MGISVSLEDSSVWTVILKRPQNYFLITEDCSLWYMNSGGFLRVLGFKSHFIRNKLSLSDLSSNKKKSNNLGFWSQ